MTGACTRIPLPAVRLQAANLFRSLPDLTPQKSAALTSRSVVRFTTNSPCYFRRCQEYRLRRTEIDSIGGSEHTVPAQATVMIFGIPAAL